MVSVFHAGHNQLNGEPLGGAPVGMFLRRFSLLWPFGNFVSSFERILALVHTCTLGPLLMCDLHWE